MDSLLNAASYLHPMQINIKLLEPESIISSARIIFLLKS